jgi:hypothetical protein
MTKTSTLISRDSATEKLGPYIPASQYDTLTHYSYVLSWLVNYCGYSVSIALHLVLFEYGEAMNSEQTKPATKLLA